MTGGAQSAGGGPLEGLVVLDFTQLAQGPFATQILGDLGAEIVKVEPPKGDWMRRYALANHYPGGESISFLTFNRNKRSIGIDLKNPRGLDVAQRLVAAADVVVENFRPGVMDRLGIGYETLREINPRIVYCASSGYGQTGPYRDRPGQDLLVQALTGLTYLNGRDCDPPTPVGIGVADLTGSLNIVYGILAALYRRAQTGIGQRVDVDLMSALLGLQIQELTTYMATGDLPSRSRTGVPPYVGAPYGIYRTADGFIAIAMNRLDTLARLLGVEQYLDREVNNSIEDRDEVKDALQKAFGRRTTAEWFETLSAEDVWCAPVNDYTSVVDDAQVRENGLFVDVEHPLAGTYRTVGVPVRFSESPGRIRRPPPATCEHTDELLAEYCGFSADEICELRKDEVVS